MPGRGRNFQFSCSWWTVQCKVTLSMPRRSALRALESVHLLIQFCEPRLFCRLLRRFWMGCV